MTTVGAFGVELGAFGACAFGVGEGASGVDLGLVVCLEGIAFAGGVVTDTAGFGAGVGFGLAGTVISVSALRVVWWAAVSASSRSRAWRAASCRAVSGDRHLGPL